jgi:glycosyltransferase involved in cell wall biosynthesis
LKVSVQIATRDRVKPLCRAIASVLSQGYANFEILVLDDASDSADVCSVLQATFDDARIRCFRNEEWSGIAAVRSRMMELGDGDIYCSIDDDGAFAHEGCLARIVEAFQSDFQLGLLAGKIKDYRDGRERLLLPFGKASLAANPELPEGRHKVSYFLAGCYAVRREVTELCGGYRPEMKYGEEELDLSYRVIAAGYDIVYDPGIVAYHWPEPSAIKSEQQGGHSEIYYQIKNRFLLMYSYIPGRYIPSYAAIWFSRYFFTSLKRGVLRDYFAGMRDGMRELRGRSRSRLSPRAVTYLRQHHGRLWY